MLIQKLKNRAEAGLSNKSEEIEPEHLSEAVSDTTEIVGDRELELPYQVDIAYYRLLLILDAHITEEDTKLYEMALKQLKIAPLKSVSSQDKKEFGFVKTKQRGSEFRCL